MPENENQDCCEHGDTGDGCGHSHDHAGCSHGPAGMHVHGATEGPMLWVSLGITLVFVAGETAAGLSSRSLALLSDAGHNFSDAFALGLAAYAIWIARKPANPQKTFGYHRVAVLVALANAASLILIAFVVIGEAIRLLRHPEPIQGSLMMAVAAVSVVMNTVIATLLARAAKHSLNMRAAFIHMAGDALSAVGVLIAGYVVRQTGWVYADPLVSLLIAAFILWSSWGIVRDATNILLESTPKGLDMAAMVAAMERVPEVLAVHDLHVWTVSDGLNFLACHVEVAANETMESCALLIARLDNLLASEFGIGHATIQTEIAGRCGDGSGSSLLCLDGGFAVATSPSPSRPESRGELAGAGRR